MNTDSERPSSPALFFVPLASLAILAAVGLVGHATCARWVIASAEMAIAVIASLLLWRRGDRAALASTACVFLLGASLSVAQGIDAASTQPPPPSEPPVLPPPRGVMRPVPAPTGEMPPVPAPTGEMPPPPMDENAQRLEEARKLLVGGRAKEAIGPLREASDAAEKGGDQPTFLKTVAMLADALLQSEDFRSALEAARRGIQQVDKEKASDPKWAPPESAVHLFVLEGLALSALGEGDPLASLARASETVEEFHAKNVALRGLVVEKTAMVHEKKGDLGKVVALLEAHVAWVEENASEDFGAVAGWRELLGRAAGNAGRNEFAERSFNLAAEARVRQEGPESQKAAFDRVNRALFLQKMGRIEEARTLVAEARKLLDAQLPEDHEGRRFAASLAASLDGNPQ